jgi:hypothetical protein
VMFYWKVASLVLASHAGAVSGVMMTQGASLRLAALMATSLVAAVICACVAYKKDAAQ